MFCSSLCTVINLSDRQIFLVTEWRRRWNTNGRSSRRCRGSREERSGLKQHAHSLLITFQWTELWVCSRQIRVKPFKKSYPLLESFTYSPWVWKSTDYLQINLVWWWMHLCIYLPFVQFFCSVWIGLSFLCWSRSGNFGEFSYWFVWQSLRRCWNFYSRN